MSDARTRELERRWRTSGAAEDERAYLAARRQAGGLGPGSLRVAAYLGDAVARAFLSEDEALALTPPKTGAAKFLEQLPGDDDPEVQRRAGLAAARFASERAEALSAEGRAAFEAAVAACEAPGPEAEARAGAAAEAMHGVLGRSFPGFDPALPVIAYSYEVTAEDAAELACYAAARIAAGLERDSRYPWGDVFSCAVAAADGRRPQERALRQAVTEALLPWVLLREDGGGAAPAGEDDAPPADPVFAPTALTPAVAEAVRAAAPPAGAKAKRLTTDQARAVIEAYLLAQGWRLTRGAYVDPDRRRRVKLMKRALQLLEGGPGRWKKVTSNAGREMLLIDTAQRLLEQARRRT